MMCQATPSEWGISINSFNYVLREAVACGAQILNVRDAYDFITGKNNRIKKNAIQLMSLFPYAYQLINDLSHYDGY